MHIYVSKVCTIEPSFFNTMSRMHRRPNEGRHLVYYMNEAFIHYKTQKKHNKIIALLMSLAMPSSEVFDFALCNLKPFA